MYILKDKMNNIYNQLASSKDIENIINNHVGESINVTINDINIYRRTFMHKSFLIKDDMADDDDNCCVFDIEVSCGSSYERLEFLGDSFLNLATAEYLFDKFPDKKEGFLTDMRSKLVRKTQLSFLGEKIGLNKWLLISSHVERVSGRSNPRIIEDIFESFIAAIYIDQGHDICRKFIHGCFNSYINMEVLVQTNDNHKLTLLRFFQTKSWSHPVYSTIFHTGDVYNRNFTSVVLLKKNLYNNDCPHVNEVISKQKDMMEKIDNIEGKVAFENLMKDNYILCKGVGKTKKHSEQESSLLALNILKVPWDF